MILTCPSCETRFHVEPDHFGQTPRKVRCSRCRQVWMQEPLPEPEPPPVPSVVQEAAQRAQAEADAARKPEPAEDDDWVPPPPPGGKPPAPEKIAPAAPDDDYSPPPPRITGFDDEPDLPLRDMDRPPLHPPLDEPLSGEEAEDPDDILNKRRARLAEAGVQPRVAQPRKKRSWAWIGWLLLFAVVGGIGYGGYEKRVELVAFYPPLAKLYELVGIPVDAAQWIGLELHNLKSSTILEGGQTKIAVSGDVVNVGEAERTLPPLRIAMRGAGGSDLGAVLVKLEQTSIEGAERLSFDIRLPAPKDEVVDLEVAFSSQPAP
jgi:predicted Zn finger-like uncharacterized protein